MFVCRRVEPDGETEEAGNCFPLLVWRRAVEIAAARFFGELFHFFHCENLAGFRRELRRGRRHRARLERVDFAGVEPNEVTMLANINIYCSLVRKRDSQHRIDAFGSKGAAQQLDRDSAPAARVAAPKNSMRGLRFFQRELTTWTSEVCDFVRHEKHQSQSPIPRETSSSNIQIRAFCFCSLLIGASPGFGDWCLGF